MTPRGLRLLRWSLIAISNQLPWPLFVGLRAQLYRLAGAEIGPGARIAGQQLVGDPQHLRIGAGVGINARCIFDASAPITIGAGSLIGPGVQIFTSHHTPDFTLEGRSVTIGERTWVGGGATFMPGCVLEGGSTVAAATVMLGRTYTSGVYFGVPARRVRPADR